MPLEWEGVVGEGDGVMGGKQRDQAEGEAAAGPGQPEAIQPKPGETEVCGVWRKRGRCAVGGGTCHPPLAGRLVSQPGSSCRKRKKNGCSIPLASISPRRLCASSRRKTS